MDNSRIRASGMHSYGGLASILDTGSGPGVPQYEAMEPGVGNVASGTEGIPHADESHKNTGSGRAPVAAAQVAPDFLASGRDFYTISQSYAEKGVLGLQYHIEQHPLCATEGLPDPVVGLGFGGNGCMLEAAVRLGDTESVALLCKHYPEAVLNRVLHLNSSGVSILQQAVEDNVNYPTVALEIVQKLCTACKAAGKDRQEPEFLGAAEEVIRSLHHTALKHGILEVEKYCKAEFPGMVRKKAGGSRKERPTDGADSNKKVVRRISTKRVIQVLGDVIKGVRSEFPDIWAPDKAKLEKILDEILDTAGGKKKSGTVSISHEFLDNLCSKLLSEAKAVALRKGTTLPHKDRLLSYRTVLGSILLGHARLGDAAQKWDNFKFSEQKIAASDSYREAAIKAFVELEEWRSQGAPQEGSAATPGIDFAKISQTLREAFKNGGLAELESAVVSAVRQNEALAESHRFPKEMLGNAGEDSLLADIHAQGDTAACNFVVRNFEVPRSYSWSAENAVLSGSQAQPDTPQARKASSKTKRSASAPDLGMMGPGNAQDQGKTSKMKCSASTSNLGTLALSAKPHTETDDMIARILRDTYKENGVAALSDVVFDMAFSDGRWQPGDFEHNDFEISNAARLPARLLGSVDNNLLRDVQAAGDIEANSFICTLFDVPESYFLRPNVAKDGKAQSAMEDGFLARLVKNFGALSGQAFAGVARASSFAHGGILEASQVIEEGPKNGRGETLIRALVAAVPHGATVVGDILDRIHLDPIMLAEVCDAVDSILPSNSDSAEQKKARQTVLGVLCARGAFLDIGKKEYKPYKKGLTSIAKIQLAATTGDFARTIGHGVVSPKDVTGQANAIVNTVVLLTSARGIVSRAVGGLLSSARVQNVLSTEVMKAAYDRVVEALAVASSSIAAMRNYRSSALGSKIRDVDGIASLAHSAAHALSMLYAASSGILYVLPPDIRTAHTKQVGAIEDAGRLVLSASRGMLDTITELKYRASELGELRHIVLTAAHEGRLADVLALNADLVDNVVALYSVLANEDSLSYRALDMCAHEGHTRDVIATVQQVGCFEDEGLNRALAYHLVRSSSAQRTGSVIKTILSHEREASSRGDGKSLERIHEFIAALLKAFGSLNSVESACVMGNVAHAALDTGYHDVLRHVVRIAAGQCEDHVRYPILDAVVNSIVAWVETAKDASEDTIQECVEVLAGAGRFGDPCTTYEELAARCTSPKVAEFVYRDACKHGLIKGEAAPSSMACTVRGELVRVFHALRSEHAKLTAQGDDSAHAIQSVPEGLYLPNSLVNVFKDIAHLTDGQLASVGTDIAACARKLTAEIVGNTQAGEVLDDLVSVFASDMAYRISKVMSSSSAEISMPTSDQLRLPKFPTLRLAIGKAGHWPQNRCLEAALAALKKVAQSVVLEAENGSLRSGDVKRFVDTIYEAHCDIVTAAESLDKGSAEARSEFDLNLRSAIRHISYAVSHSAGIPLFSPEIAGRILRATAFLDMAAGIEGRTASGEHKEPVEELKQSISDAYHSVGSAIHDLGGRPSHDNQPPLIDSVNKGLDKVKSGLVRAMDATASAPKHTGKERRMSMSGTASWLHYAKLVLRDTARLIIKKLSIASSCLADSLYKAIGHIGRAMIFVHKSLALLVRIIPYALARSTISKIGGSKARPVLENDYPIETQDSPLRKSLANVARNAVDDVESAAFELLKHKSQTSSDNDAMAMLLSARPILQEIYNSEQDVDAAAIPTEELYASQQAVLHRCAEQISLLSVRPGANALVGKALTGIVCVVLRLQELRTKTAPSLEVPYEFLENAAKSLEYTLRIRSAAGGVRASIDKKRLQEVIRGQAALCTSQETADKCKIASGADIALMFKMIISEHNATHLENSCNGERASPLSLIKEIAEEAQVSVEGSCKGTKRDEGSISLPATFIYDLLSRYSQVIRLSAAIEGVSVEVPQQETIMGIVRTLFPEEQHGERITLSNAAGIVSAFGEVSTILRNQVQEYSASVATRPIAEMKTSLDLVREVVEGGTQTPDRTGKGDGVRITLVEDDNVVVPSAVAHSAILASMLATQNAVISQMGEKARSLPRFTAEYIGGLVGKKFPAISEQLVELSLEHIADVYKEFERALQQNSTYTAGHIKIPDGFVAKISNIVESVARKNAVEGAESVVHEQIRGKVYTACVIALHKEHYKSAILPTLRDMVASIQGKHAEVSDVQLEKAAEYVVSLVEDSWGTENVPAETLNRGIASIIETLFPAESAADTSQVGEKEGLGGSSSRNDSMYHLLKAHKGLQDMVNSDSCRLSDGDVARLAEGILSARKCVLDLLHRDTKATEQYSGEEESVIPEGVPHSEKIFAILHDVESLLVKIMDDNSQLAPEVKELVSSAHGRIGEVLASAESSGKIAITHMKKVVRDVAKTLFSPVTLRKCPLDMQQNETYTIWAVCGNLAVLAHLIEAYSSEDITLQAGKSVPGKTPNAPGRGKDKINRSADVELEKHSAAIHGKLLKHLRQSVTLLRGVWSLCTQDKRMREKYAIHGIYLVKKLDDALSCLEQAMEIVHSPSLEEDSSAEARSAAIARIKEHIERSAVSCILSSARAYAVSLPGRIFNALSGSGYSVLSALIELRRSLGEDMRHTKVPPESKAALAQVSTMISLAKESMEAMVDPAEADPKHVRETHSWSLRSLDAVEYLLQFINHWLFAAGQEGYVKIMSNVSEQLKICQDNLESFKHCNSKNALLHKKIAELTVRVARDLVDERILQKVDTQEILNRWAPQEGDAKHARDLAIATVRMHEATANVRELADVMYTIDAEGNTIPEISAAEILCKTVYAEAKPNFNSVSHEEVSKSLDLLIADTQSLMGKLKNVTLKLANSTSLAEARELIWNDIAFIIDVSSKKRSTVASEEIQQLFAKTATLVESVRDALPTSLSKAQQAPADDQEVAAQDPPFATAQEESGSHTEHGEAPQKYSVLSEEFRTILNTSFKLSEQEAAAPEILDGYARISKISVDLDRAAELLRNTSSFGEDLEQTKLLAVTAFSNAVTLLALLEKQHGGCIPQNSSITLSNSDVLHKAVDKYGMEAAGPVVAKFEIIVSQLALRTAVDDLRHTVQVLSAREEVNLERVKQAKQVLQVVLDNSLALLEDVTKRTDNLINASMFAKKFEEVVGQGLRAASARALEFGYNRRGYSGLLESMRNIQGSLGKQRKLAANHDLLENMIYIGDLGSVSFLCENTEFPDALCFEKVVNTIAGAMRKGAIPADAALALIKTVTDIRDESLQRGGAASAKQQVRGDITQIVTAFYEQGHEGGLKFLRQKYNKHDVNAKKVETAMLGRLTTQRQITAMEEILLQGPERWVFSDLDNDEKCPTSKRQASGNASEAQRGIECVMSYIKSQLHTRKNPRRGGGWPTRKVSSPSFWRRCGDAINCLVTQTAYIFRLLYRGGPGSNDLFLTRLRKASEAFFYMLVSVILFVFAKRPICLSGAEEVKSDQVRRTERGTMVTKEGHAASGHNVDCVDAKDTSPMRGKVPLRKGSPNPKNAEMNGHEQKIMGDGQPSLSTASRNFSVSPVVLQGRHESIK